MTEVKVGQVSISVDDLKRIHRDLDSCQKVIWLHGGFDPAYCNDAQESLKLIDAALSTEPQPSDLEIVQKALALRNDSHIELYIDGSATIYNSEAEGLEFSGASELLVWAKQQIGE